MINVKILILTERAIVMEHVLMAKGLAKHLIQLVPDIAKAMEHVHIAMEMGVTC